ncbi:hypothetical protein OUZ56_027285 [Daphnia magna]|uniref:Uncharacterized protein n=1 Tax=Daphnia magna TaxID=35525 RepID=A0ABQ9ZPC6_9CRUS|nr:hypothetical protein OUZ56_027285 [Daphnia magna]
MPFNPHIASNQKALYQTPTKCCSTKNIFKQNHLNPDFDIIQTYAVYTMVGMGLREDHLERRDGSRPPTVIGSIPHPPLANGTKELLC